MESALSLDQRQAARGRAAALTASLVLVGLSLALLVKRILFPTVEGAGPLGYLYDLVFGPMVVFSILTTVLLRWRPRRWVETALALGVLGFGTALTWVDLHFGDDYTGFTIAIFGLGVFYSASRAGYAGLLALGFAGLTGWAALTIPHQLVLSELGTRTLIVILAFIGCTQLERQRVSADKLTVQLEAANALLRETSVRDVLTGLYNRRFLLEFLESRRALSIRMEIPLSVVLVDIDHFKSINDRFGHPVGDGVLRDLAQELLDGLRESDLAARYGGEEFILVLPQANARNAGMVAGRILDQVRSRQFTGLPEPVTFSAGVAELKEKESVESLLARADRRLYAAKKTRNQVVWDDPAEPVSPGE